MSNHRGLKSFRKVKNKLATLDIIWRPNRGRGSHGCFIGPNQETGHKQAYPIPASQQREICPDYLNRLRRRFGLEGKKWDDFFD
jgi:hypothetical protein